jgi:hypothetical protein
MLFRYRLQERQTHSWPLQQPSLHVCVSRVWRADRVVWLAVFAQLAGVGVWLEACVLLCGSGCTAIGYLAASECEGLVCAAPSGSKRQNGGDCRIKSAYMAFLQKMLVPAL